MSNSLYMHIPIIYLIVLVLMGCSHNKVQEEALIDLQKEIIALHKYNLQTNRRIEELNKNSLDVNRKLEEFNKNLLEMEGKIEESNQTIKELKETIPQVGSIAAKIEQGNNESKKQKVREEFKEPQEMEKPQTKIKEKNKIQAKMEKESISDPRELYLKAFNKFTIGDYDQAIAGFREFIAKFPNHDYTDNAYYWLGEIHYSEKRFPQAIIEFKKVVEQHPEGNKVPDALLKLGLTYINLKDLDNAGFYFQSVIDQFPFSDAAKKAGLRMREMDY